jgi:hypothetical protein
MSCQPGSIKIFGDVHPYGAWSELDEGVDSHILSNLVALASYIGDFTECAVYYFSFV